MSKKRYKVLLEAIPDIFFVIGKDGTYEDFVIKESDLFKVEDANIVGSTIFDVGFPENMSEKIFRCVQNCLKNNSIETIEYSLNTPNGTYLFEMRLAKLNSSSVISIARDITRRKNAEFSLEKAKKKAEESDRLKSVFLTNLSHEIRTPLHIITSFTKMLTESRLKTTEKAELSEAIIQNGNQLMNMINNTIHLSKIETGTVDVSFNFCKINNLVKKLYNQYNPLIPETRQVKLLISLDVPNPAFGFKTDSNLLMEIFELLLDNAIKYTLQGEILIKYEMLRNEEIKFTVSDTGIGIPPEEINNIFSRFYRIKNEINDITSGSGIGLPIAKQFIEILGGELTLDTEPGKGTTVTFSLPFKEGEGYLRVVS
jgi:PAS domain S-box-containing protein